MEQNNNEANILNQSNQAALHDNLASNSGAAAAQNPFLNSVLKNNKTKKSKKGMFIFIGIMAVCIVLAIVVNVFKSPDSLSSFTKKAFSDNNIAVLRVVGTISQQPNSGYNQQYFLNSIDKITKDKKNRGILLYIDSPGGAVYESDELYLKLMKYKQDTGRPIYVSMSHLAASGGYYLSAAGDKIYANRNTLTGSIGVIAGSSLDLTGLFEKHGIKMTTITAGKNKNMLNYNSPMTEEQRQIMQSVADEAYNQFVDIIAKARGMSIEQVKALADGRIYTPIQALNNGLIDGIATFEEVKEKMKSDLNLDDPYFDDFSYQYTSSIFDVMAKSAINPLKGYSEFDFINSLDNPLINGPAYLYAN